MTIEPLSLSAFTGMNWVVSVKPKLACKYGPEYAEAAGAAGLANGCTKTESVPPAIVLCPESLLVGIRAGLVIDGSDRGTGWRSIGTGVCGRAGDPPAVSG